MTFPFLSEEWMAAAKAVREKYADQATQITTIIKMNQVITDVPFGDGTLKVYLDTSSGMATLEYGEMEAPDLTVTTDYETARQVFVEQNQAAGMTAFIAGKVKVQGDMMKMMALQTAMPRDEVALRIALEIKNLTS